MGRTTYVLDTSVLLSAGQKALYSFEGGEVVLPLAVIKELEKKRNDPILGFLAREVLRTIEELRVQHGDDLKNGVDLGNNSTVRLEVNHVDQRGIPNSLRDHSIDVGILAVAKNLASETEDKVVLVSNDLPLRIVSQLGVGIEATEFRTPELNQGNFTGIVHAHCHDSVIEHLYAHPKGVIDYDEVEFEADPHASNVGVILKSSKSSILLVGHGETKTLSRVQDERQVFEISGRSAEQKIAIKHLTNKAVDVVSLGGRAGTGKTLLALAAGIDQVLESHIYNRVVVFRPLLAVGNQSLGYLPGTEEEKMAPWAGAVYDALEAITGGSKNLMERIKDDEVLEVLPITHIRGRTLTKTFIIIDEAQNLERNVLLSILSRVGEGTKVVLCWDAAQKDNLNISRNDGIVALVDRLKEESLFAHVTFTRSERSRVAKIASEILEDMSAN